MGTERVGRVSAVLVDENTLDVSGVRFVRDGYQPEVLLQPTSNAVAPNLRCSSCGFERRYTYWYGRLDYQERIVNHCPGCGCKIMGVVGLADDLGADGE